MDSNHHHPLHIVIFPFLAQGHIIPTIDLAKLFASRGLKASVVTTPANLPNFQPPITRANALSKFLHPIQISLIPFPTVPDLPEGCENMASVPQHLKSVFFHATSLLQSPFHDILQDLQPDCVVAGLFFPWIHTVASRLRIPSLDFHGSNFSSKCLSDSVERHKLLENTLPETVVLPDLPHRIEMHRGLIPDFKKVAPFVADFKVKQKESETMSYGTIVNSFYELEAGYVEYYRNIMGKRSWHVGPLLLNDRNMDSFDRGSKSDIDEGSCLKWLGSRRSGSVLYVCFGSTGFLSPAQMREIALGLEGSGHLFTHLLSLKMVQSFQHVREQEVQILIDTISIKSSSGRIVNMSEVLNIFILDIICRAVGGKFRDEAMKKMMCEIIDKGGNLNGKHNPADLFPIIGLAGDIGLYTIAKKHAEKIDICLEELMKDHAAQFEKDGLRQDTNFIGALVSLEKNSGSNSDFPFTKETYRALLIDVFTAGVDTTYIVLEWSMAELIKNPKTMKRLQDEVRSVGNNKNLIGEDDLKSANFLKAVIKESMRLHPPGAILLPREAREDCEIAGYHIPKGTTVMINAWAIARDPESWEEPEEFRPERFLNSDIDYKGNNFEYLPFGAGRRICPGMNFSMPEVELAIANLVRMFDWELPKDMTVEDFDMEEAPGITVRRKNSLKLCARPFSFE